MEEATHAFTKELDRISMEIKRAAYILNRSIQEDLQEKHPPTDETTTKTYYTTVDVVELVQKIHDLPYRIDVLKQKSISVCKRREDIVDEVTGLLSNNVAAVRDLREKADVEMSASQQKDLEQGALLLQQCCSVE
mmetsp:Transcript_11264/g.14713  ORF Transcript_11264/g.14713 Transcript_11264/m.14713 type:complete len:135 (-) Transcript_11264:721-1125(-)